MCFMLNLNQEENGMSRRVLGTQVAAIMTGAWKKKQGGSLCWMGSSQSSRGRQTCKGSINFYTVYGTRLASVEDKNSHFS